MPNVPAFLLCENEQEERESAYVIHTRAPRFLARLDFNALEDTFSVVDEYDPIPAADKVKLLQQLEDWYDNYQAYLDDEYGEEE